MRILLTEGSGLTSRQVATRLGRSGHHVEILSSTPLCLSRFTRHVRKVHPVPPFGRAPLDWLKTAAEIVRRREIDLLFPTQEQVTVLAARRNALTCATVVPEFESLLRVQDKISAYKTLAAAGLPQPPTILVQRPEDLARVDQFPVFIKRPVGTASSGVRRAKDLSELLTAASALGMGEQGLIVQQECIGRLAMVQAIADNGRLIAQHANLRVQEGSGGGAAIKESVTIPRLAEHLQALVAHLSWHGPISLDVILTDKGPVVIDINPRLVEPMNAYLAGVDLVEAMLSLARHQSLTPQPSGRPGVRSHQLLIAVLGAAQFQASRYAIVKELVRALRKMDPYAGSVEELTPTRGDPVSAIPVLAAVLLTLAWPHVWRLFHSGAVGSYALTPEAWAQIVSFASNDTRHPAGDPEIDHRARS
jgi:glutathione synthase/RimK-type ligase-like ATP-grasp enzyme